MRNAASEFQIVSLFKMSFICIRIKKHFHINGFALSLALKQRLGATRKWPVDILFFKNDEKRARFGGRKVGR